MRGLGKPQGEWPPSTNVATQDQSQFFMIFTFWAVIFCLYIMGFLIAVAAKSEDLDGQIIALIIM